MNEQIGIMLRVTWAFWLVEMGTANFMEYFVFLSIEVPNNLVHKEKPVTQYK